MANHAGIRQIWWSCWIKRLNTHPDPAGLFAHANRQFAAEPFFDMSSVSYEKLKSNTINNRTLKEHNCTT